ncbi:hypothetical protein Dimus_021172, partial [Dionaea muscipula]
MGKLGKKARKFAKKNLQSVLKKKRKFKSRIREEEVFKVTASGWFPFGGVHDSLEDVTGDETAVSNGRELLNENIEDGSLSIISSEDDDYLAEDVSDSDGYLSEDSALSSKNQKIRLKLAKRKEKLERLKKKDPKFEEFLSNHAKDLDSLLKKEMYSDEDEASNEDREFADGDDISPSDQRRLVTASMINSWSETTIQKHSLTSLPSLLNAYRAACEYGAKSSGAYGSVVSPRLQDSNTFVSIIMFMLRESDSIFRTHLDMLSNKSKTETVSQMESTPKWKALEPMVKSYLRSTVYLLNQLADTEILFYALNRLRASIIFFAAFPSLLRKLIQVAVNLWTTSGGNISSCSFGIIYDAAAFSLGPDCYGNCLRKVYKAFMACCRGVGSANLRHIESLRDSCVELCSLDLQKSVSLALLSMQKLAKIFQLGLQRKKEETLKKICSWEYVLCLELWVKFVSANVRDLDGFLYPLIQLVNGIVYLFPAPRYLPLRVRCIRLMNHLSHSSRIFIPVSSLVVDILEYATAKEVGKSEKIVDVSSYLK